MTAYSDGLGDNIVPAGKNHQISCSCSCCVMFQKWLWLCPRQGPVLPQACFCAAEAVGSRTATRGTWPGTTSTSAPSSLPSPPSYRSRGLGGQMFLPPATDSLPASNLHCPFHCQALIGCYQASTLAPSSPLSQPPSWPQDKRRP